MHSNETESRRSGRDEDVQGPGAGQPWLEPLAIALLVAVSFAVDLRFEPPTADPGAGEDAFSGARALATLSRVLADGVPHPTGSEANRRVRDRLIGELRALGLEPEVETAIACSDGGTCARVENLVTQLAPSAGTLADPSAGGSDALVILSHYDSVAAAPGANDDGTGLVVTLETVRALLAAEAPRQRALWLVMTDGEEGGLIGAHAFARNGERMARIGAVLNVEARGSGGPSLMFETGPGSGELVKLYGRVCPRPIASSVFTWFYERMPNDTDLSVMKRAGLPGLNFAHVRRVEHYHTPRDTLANVSVDTLAHHGACVLALSRELLARRAPLERTDRAFFDVLAFGLVSWPLGWSLPLALAAALLCLGGALRAMHGASARPTTTLAAIALPGLISAAAIAGGHAAVVLLASASEAAAPWTAQPVGPLIAVLGSASAAALLLGGWAAPRVGAGLLWGALWTQLAAWAVALAIRIPEASPPLLASSLAAGSAYWLSGAPPQASARFGVVILIGTLGGALTFLPIVGSGFDPLGFALSPALTIPVGLAIACALPALAGATRAVRYGAPLAVAGVATGGFAAALIADAHDAAHPMPLSIRLVQNSGEPRSHWFASARGGPLPAAVAAAAPFGTAPETRPATLTGHGDVYRASGPAVPAEAPVVEILSNEMHRAERVVSLRLRSARGAERIGLLVPTRPKLHAIRMEGQLAPSLTARWIQASPGWSRHVFLAPQAEGVRVDLRLEGLASSFGIVVFDRSAELPPEATRSGANPLAARPPWAVPVGSGDGFLVTQSVTIPAVAEAR